MPIIAEALSRLGTESAFEVLARVKALEDAGRDIINLGIGQPDFPTPDNVVEAAVKALRDGHHGYTPAQGIRPLREAVAADVEARWGGPIDPDTVIIVPGGKVTMFFAMIIFGESGAEILYPDPGFPIYRSMIAFTGAKPVPIPLHEAAGFSFDAAEVLERITPATRLIILNSPANPTGGVVPRDEMDRLAAGLEAHPDIAILSDEIYSRMVYEGADTASPLDYPHLRHRTILLDGWSKTFAMTGWRLGYGVWPTSLVETVQRLAINCHSCVNAPTQVAGIEALTGPQGPVERMVAAFDERRRLIVPALDALPGFACSLPGGAFYAFPNITGTGLTSAALQDKLLDEAGVATIAGTSFGDGGEGYLRVSYANSSENITTAVERIRACL